MVIPTREFTMTCDRCGASMEAANLWGVSEEDVRREFATTRHLELLRSHKQPQQVLIALF